MRPHPRPVLRPLALAAALCAAVLAAPAPRAEATSKLEGIVVDKDGNGLEKVEIVMTSEKYRTRVQKGKSKKDGKFVFPFIETGPQLMEVKYPGYRVLRVQVESRGKDDPETHKDDWILGPKDTVPAINVPFTEQFGICKVRVTVAKEEEYVDAYRALRRPAEGGEKAAEVASALAPQAQAPSGEVADPYDSGRQLAEKGQHAEAVPLFQKALEQSPDNQVYLIALGRSHLEAGQSAEAEATLQKLLAVNPGYVSANYYLGKAQLANYKNAAAIASFQKEIELSPDKRASLLLHIANTQIEMAKTQPATTDQALATLEEVLALEPANASALSQTAEIYRQKGNRPKQEELYKRLVEADPQNADVTFFNLGAIAFNANRREEAATNFRKALEINPKYAEAHYQLATCLVGMGKFPEAVAHYEQFLTLEPSGKRSEEVKKMIVRLKG